MSGHEPVLLEQVMSMIKETPIPLEYFMDGTFGRGGHTRAVMQTFPEVKVVAVDRDEDALNFGRENFAEELHEGRIAFVHSRFDDVASIREQVSSFVGKKKLSGILLDLGVSSPQLDEAHRGFSFYNDGPLDMRMDRSCGVTAADIVNTWEEDELGDLFYKLGEVTRPRRVVRAIMEARKSKPFKSTMELSGLIEATEGWRRKGHHPATRYFLALRLEVNKELEAVEKSLLPLIEELEEGGRLLVISFHSLEDRIVKLTFKANKHLGILINKKVIQATWDEKKSNPRARSAKLRVFQKGASS